MNQLQNAGLFHGLPTDDPYAHISKFFRVCETYKQNGALDDAIQRMLFKYSLNGNARGWFERLELQSITSFTQLLEKIVYQYFPPTKAARILNEIRGFTQFNAESIHEAWERFKNLLRKCPHHGQPRRMQLHIFYGRLKVPNRSQLDAAAGGAFMGISIDDGFNLVEKITWNNYHWQSEITHHPKKVTEVQELKDLRDINAKIDRLTSIVAQLYPFSANVVPTLGSVYACEGCGGPHASYQCTPGHEVVNYVNNHNRST